jgi:branched-chain amino acid transport system permease protein
VTEFLQLCVAGLALGARYALVALGFVIIYRATGVINFAQGGLLALGAYFTYAFANSFDLTFALAAVAAVGATALVGAATERVVLRPMVGQPVFAVIMITIGLLFIIEQVITSIWGFDNLWTIGLAAAALGGFFVFFRLSKLGVAMRAVAFDQEVALAQGISVRRVVMVSWAIAGALAALAGLTLASGPAALSPGISAIAGAVLGGIIIGLTQSLTSGYQDDFAPWAGENLAAVMPYFVMIAILLIRPHGLFGTPEVRRV